MLTALLDLLDIWASGLFKEHYHACSCSNTRVDIVEATCMN